ncbi:MAG: VOC family protein [Chloroflexia bacterium]
MAITRVQTVGVYVRDQQAALDFYKDKLGFEVRQDAPMGEPGGDRWIEVAPPGAETGIVLSTPASMGGYAERIGSFSGYVLSSDDVQKTHEELSGRGVRFNLLPEAQPYGMQAIFADQDGNEFVLVGPLPAG